MSAATNETGTVPSLQTEPRQFIKVAGVHLRGVRAIQSLDLPKDGLGWGDGFPDQVVVGGINGSGKTTLLDFLFDAFCAVFAKHRDLSRFQAYTQGWVDFRFWLSDSYNGTVRFVFGDEAFVDENKSQAQMAVGAHYDDKGTNIFFTKNASDWFLGGLFETKSKIYVPCIIYFPSSTRTLVTPEEVYKAPGRISPRRKTCYRWEPPQTWKDSLEARLYSARWDDLNAKDEGRPDEAQKFSAYSKAFELFFEGRKRLSWHRAELVVETKNGVRHGLNELSSGEKQVVLLVGELLHRWRPGGLVLIDEPELHLHSSWQYRLWESLVHWQRELDGQIIVATQSSHLFAVSEPGTHVLLGGARL